MGRKMEKKISEEILLLRKKIDTIDGEIMNLLSERVLVSKKIGKIKRTHGKPIVDISRENEIYDRIMDLAEKLGISPEDSKNVYQEIIKMCRNAQKT